MRLSTTICIYSKRYPLIWLHLPAYVANDNGWAA